MHFLNENTTVFQYTLVLLELNPCKKGDYCIYITFHVKLLMCFIYVLSADKTLILEHES